MGPTLASSRNSEVSRFLLTEPFAPEDAARVVEKRRQQVHPTQPGGTLALVVEHEGDLVGDVMLQLVGGEGSIGEIGWCFDPAHSGRGFATEAAHAVLDLAFDTPTRCRAVAEPHSLRVGMWLTHRRTT